MSEDSFQIYIMQFPNRHPNCPNWQPIYPDLAICWFDNKIKWLHAVCVFVCLCAQRNDLQSGFDALPKALQPSPSLPLLHDSYFGRGNYFRYKRKWRFRVAFPLLSLPWIPPSLVVLANVILGGLLASLVSTSFCTKFPSGLVYLLYIYVCFQKPQYKTDQKIQNNGRRGFSQNNLKRPLKY